MKAQDAPPARVAAHSHKWRADFRWAARLTGAFAGIYSAVVLLQTVLQRSTYWSRYHTTTWRILAGYWGAAAVVAVILAYLRPWLGRRGGAALAGLFGGVAVYGVVGLATGKASDWGDVVATAILGGLLGLGLSMVFYDDDHSERMSTERQGHRIAFMLAGAVVLIFLTWAMTYPPLCWLGGKYCR
jgi:hypothetical protein